MKKGKLKPCPFCGGKARLYHPVSKTVRPYKHKNLWEIDCSAEGCALNNHWQRIFLSSSKKFIIRKWNTRSKEK